MKPWTQAQAPSWMKPPWSSRLSSQWAAMSLSRDFACQGLRLLHRCAHHGVRLHAVAVVGEGDDVPGHARHVGEGFPGLIHGDRAVGTNVDNSVPFDDVQLGAQVGYTVGHRVQVRHGADGRVAAPCRRHRAGANGLLIGKTRLSQMYVYICEAGYRIKKGLCKGAGGGGDGDNATAADAQIRRNKPPVHKGHHAVDCSLQGAFLPPSAGMKKTCPSGRLTQ